MQEDPEKITYFAATNSRGKEISFGVKRRDRARHMYVIGKTGMGKSTLLENMAIQDIRNGEGMAFIDPHGSTADRIMEYVPEERIKDVVYFAPFDMEYPVAFNVMEDVGYDKRHLVVSGLLSAFRKIWEDAWSARMEYILSNTLLALLEYEGATLLDVNRMLINKAFRKKVVENVTDPIVKSFWVEEFANYTDRYTQDATPAIQNKVGQFTSNPLIRNIIGQPKSSFDIRKIMDEKKIFIMNLSKGRVGEVNATLLGSMLVTKIYLAAMSRADVSAQTLTALPSFYFYVDEFQSFANQTFADILSEARKYKLNLIIAHQYIEQMEEEVRDAVFGNVGTTVVFRVGPFDAEVLETIFMPQFTQTDLVNLGFAQIYLTLMIDGVGSPPFSATTLPPFDLPPKRYIEEVLANSRAVFGKPREEVETAIAKWHEADQESVKRTPAKNASSPEKAPYTAPAPARPSGTYTKPKGESGRIPLMSEYKRHAQAKVLGETIAQEHMVATSRAVEETPRVEVPTPTTNQTKAPYVPPPRMPSPAVSHKPPSERSQPAPVARPELSGAKSLREALEMATGKKVAPALVPQPEPRAVPGGHLGGQKAHAPDLKQALARIVSAPKEVVWPLPVQKEAPKDQKKEQAELQGAHLPEEVIRGMLAVDEPTIEDS